VTHPLTLLIAVVWAMDGEAAWPVVEDVQM